VVTGGLATPAQACGFYTHDEIVGRAYHHLNKTAYSELAAILTNYRGVANYGAMFPDWGYTMSLGDLAEIAHDTNGLRNNDPTPPFRTTLAYNLLPAYRRNPRTTDDNKGLAFLFGLIAHQEADMPWHVQGTGFEAMASKTSGVPAGAGLEADIDFIVIMTKIDFGTIDIGDWWYPVKPVLTAYGMPGSSELQTALDAGKTIQSTAYSGEYVAAGAAYLTMLADLKHWGWTFDNLVNYRQGGLEQGAALTAAAWERAWGWFRDYTPVTAISLSPAVPDGNNGWYRQPVTIKLTGTGLFAGEIDTGPFETWYTLGRGAFQKYTGPFTISTDGIHTISYYTVDHMGIKENPKRLTIRIDQTPPVVNTWVDQARYTRTQLFIVHFNGNDPQPGSGLASLTATFNNQPVANGQTVDLFWLALGNYTLAVRGEDVAGWVTENRQNIEIYATIGSLQETVSRMCKESYITQKGICKELSMKLKVAFAARERGDLKAALQILKAFQNAVKAQTGKAISLRAAWLLIKDTDYVIANLSR
jgi:hypothetical protein